MNPSEPSWSGQALTMRIIAGTQIAGALLVLGVALWLVESEGKGLAQPAEGGLPFVTLAALVFLVIDGALVVFLPAALMRQGVRRIAGSATDSPRPSDHGDTHQLIALKTSTMIIGMAMLEGVSFFGSIAYLLEARPLALVVSVVPILGLLYLFPTQERVTAWLAEQRRALEDVRRQRA